MKIGILVDAACDLSPGFIRRNNVEVLPVMVWPKDALASPFRYSQLDSGSLHAESSSIFEKTAPLAHQEIVTYFLKELILKYDCVVCITASQVRSEVYNNLVLASLIVQKTYKPIRVAAGLSSPFTMRVVDSKSLFTGQAILAIEAARMRALGFSIKDLRCNLELLSEKIVGYLAVNDIRRVRCQARKKGDRSISLLESIVGDGLGIKPILKVDKGVTSRIAKCRGRNSAHTYLFRIALEAIEKGLATDCIALSYGGAFADLSVSDEYSRFKEICDGKGIEIHETEMSLVARVNIGDNALALAFAKCY